MERKGTEVHRSELSGDTRRECDPMGAAHLNTLENYILSLNLILIVEWAQVASAIGLPLASSIGCVDDLNVRDQYETQRACAQPPAKRVFIHGDTTKEREAQGGGRSGTPLARGSKGVRRTGSQRSWGTVRRGWWEGRKEKSGGEDRTGASERARKGAKLRAEGSKTTTTRKRKGRQEEEKRETEKSGGRRKREREEGRKGEKARGRNRVFERGRHTANAQRAGPCETYTHTENSRACAIGEVALVLPVACSAVSFGPSGVMMIR
eukprot:910950-Pleurochrysis_carterae.AAC.1